MRKVLQLILWLVDRVGVACANGSRGLLCSIMALSAMVPACVAARDVTGRVVDDDSLPVGMANVVLVAGADSSFISGTVTAADGTFVVSTGRTDVLLRISSVGYVTRYVMAAGDSIGDIRLCPDNRLLGEVVVKGQVPKARVKGSTLVMDVENTLLARAGTAEDVLTQVPTVVKRKGNIEVLGKGTPAIYINGRPVRDMKELTDLQSDRIKSVEVVMNPGARYDATVCSVIIVHTKRVQGEGFSAEAGSWSRVDKGFSNNERLSLTYRKDGLELFANLFGAYDETNEKNEFDETISVDTLWNIAHGERLHGRSNFFEGKLGFNYQAGAHSFGAFYQNSRAYAKNYADYEDELTGDGKWYDRLSSSSLNKETTWPNHLANIYYNGTIGKTTIDFNADFIWRKLEHTGLSDELSREYNDRTVHTDNVAKSRMIAEKLVAVHAVGSGYVAVGEEFTAIRRVNSFSNLEGIIPGSSNEQRENSIAPFAEISQTLGKWELTLGVRYEHVVSDYYLKGVKQPGQCRTYDNVFPSFDASTQWRGLQFSFGYSAKTQRPSFACLNSDVTYENRLNYSTGNPLLSPATTHSINAMMMWKALYLMAGFDHIKNDIQYYIENYEGDSKVQLATFRNYDHRNRLSVTLGARKTVGVWNPDANVTLLKQWFEAECSGVAQKFNRPMVCFGFNNSFDLPHKWLVRLGYDLQGKGHYGLFHSDRIVQSLRLSVSKDFFGEKLHLQLDGNDLLATSYQHYTLQSNSFNISRRDNAYGRNVCLTLRYRFNAVSSKYKGTGAGNEDKGRL